MRHDRLATIAAILACSGIPVFAATTLHTTNIEQLTGLKGTEGEGGIFQVNYPRKDLHPVVAGVKMTPPMALTAWPSFQHAGDHTMVMGDIVPTQDQVNP